MPPAPRLSVRQGNSCALRLLCALAVVVFTATLAAEGVRIVPLVRDGQVLVTFELEDGFTEDVKAVIHSGLRTTFTYTIELRMEVPAWIDQTIATSVVSNTVEYDNLTRRHNISRTVDGRVEESRVTEDEAIVRAWMTSFSRLPLFRSERLEPNREYYVRVRARAYPRNGNFLWPWDSGMLGQAKFTFVR